jgi:hypothetical protein
VELLNECEVYISEPPLDAYDLDGDGEEIEDGEEVEGAGEGADDLEEIEEEVFDASQSSRKKRAVNYTEIEDTCLVRAWSQMSIDAVASNDQTGKRYWQRIEDKFFKLMPRVATPITHSYRSLQGRWDVIKASCSRWSGAMEQVRNSPPSGISIDDYVSANHFALIL